VGVEGKQILITGATDGIGLAAARDLVARHAKLAIVARNNAKAREAVAEIRKSGPSEAQVDVLIADLGSQAAIRRLASEVLERYPKLDVLINNAGIACATRELSEDGVELMWAVNHLAPFLLTGLLVDRLKASAPAHVITTASNAHRGVSIPFDDLDGKRPHRGWGSRRYKQTKLANILFTAELARRLKGTGVTANCFHPGSVASGLNRNGGGFAGVVMYLSRPLLRSAEEAAEMMVWLADAPDVPRSGGYFVDKQWVAPSDAARDMQSARRLWEVSEGQVGQTAWVVGPP
jgi:NAD(P)-dependent dehydrogenase (short-subunit alcohol dehydrogenase family)